MLQMGFGSFCELLLKGGWSSQVMWCWVGLIVFWAGGWSSGVSRSLNVTYLRPVPVGATVVVTANVVHAGRKLATVRGVIVNKEDGKICSMAEHLKVNAVPGAVL